MIRRFGSMIGVTLLEILLVLAIAAMIIVMSVRYYQGATSSQQVNAFLQQVQGIAAAADNLAIATGTYSTVSKSAVQAFLGGSTALFGLPWGGTLGVTAAVSGYTLTITAPSTAICTQIKSRLLQNTNYTINNTCSTITYSNVAGGTAASTS